METDEKKIAKNRIAVMYLLRSLNIEVTDKQLLRVVTELSVMDYFDLASVLDNLKSGQLIELRKAREGDFYTLTPLGENTLSFFEKELYLSQRNAIDEYCKEHREELQREASVAGEYVKLSDKQYRVTLRIMQKDLPVFEVSFFASNIEEAENYVKKWNERSSDVYRKVMDTLI